MKYLKTLGEQVINLKIENSDGQSSTFDKAVSKNFEFAAQ